MKKINVYDKNGNVDNIIELPEEVIPLKNRRVSKALNSKFYYKGTGIKYNGHNTYKIENNDTLIEEYKLNDNDIIKWVFRENYRDKFGIFKCKYQPYFSDYIGGCGKKENKIIYNSKNMIFSAVTFYDSFDIIDNHKIYKLTYRQEKNKKLNEESLYKIFTEIINSDWCTAYDKNILNDIDNDGYIHDPSDWFESKNFIHKFGTIYSFIYHLYYKDQDLLKKILYRYKINKTSIDVSIFTLPLICIFIIGFYNKKIITNNFNDIFYKKFNKESYNYVINNYIKNGIRCCQLEI